MNKLVQYLKESLEELKKVTWPTRKQTLNYSLAVVVISVALAAYIGVLDLGFSRGVQYIFEKKASTAPAVDTSATSQPIQVSPDAVQVEGGNVKVTPVPLDKPATK